MLFDILHFKKLNFGEQFLYKSYNYFEQFSAAIFLADFT